MGPEHGFYRVGRCGSRFSGRVGSAVLWASCAQRPVETRAQYVATRGKSERRKRPRNAVFAIPCGPSNTRSITRNEQGKRFESARRLLPLRVET